MKDHSNSEILAYATNSQKTKETSSETYGDTLFSRRMEDGSYIAGDHQKIFHFRFEGGEVKAKRKVVDTKEDNIKYKELVLKFSYEKLQALCSEKKNWFIPTIEELRNHDYYTTLDDSWVWVSDSPDHDNEDGTRAVLYNKKKDETMQVNKNFMEHAVVKKINDTDQIKG